MIDSHCHLADAKFADDLPEVIARAEEHGVEAMICIADSLEEGKKCLQLAEEYDQLFCTVGVHPHCAKDWQAGDGDRLRRMMLSSHKAKAVGEIGLDYHYDLSPRDVQKRVFREQLEVAKELNLPAVIHNRESIADLWQTVQEVNPPSAVLHCCTEKWADVAAWVQRGYFLSFTGIATYAKSDDIRDTIRRCPLRQLMIETDAPYLAPQTHRGERNEPAYVTEVAKCVAEIHGVELAEIDRVTTANTVRFFGL